MQPFKDITILGINKDSSIINERGNSEIHLRLSNDPPGEWGQLFTNAWSDTFYSMKQHAEVLGSDLVVHCHPSVLMNEHMPQLDKAVEAANQQYLSHYAAAEMAAQNEDTMKTRSSQVLDELEDQFKSRGR